MAAKRRAPRWREPVAQDIMFSIPDATLILPLLIFVTTVLVLALLCDRRMLRVGAQEQRDARRSAEEEREKQRLLIHNDCEQDQNHFSSILLVIQSLRQGAPQAFQNSDQYLDLPTPCHIHQYTDLPTSLHIRLLTRAGEELPATGNDPDTSVVFDLVSVLLDDVVNGFVAVSYCWGTDPPSKLLPLSDGSSLKVTTNVEDILLHFFGRSEEKEDRGKLYPWIDAVCINQKDTQEKNSQIQLMDKIYAGAQQVSVWF